MVVCPRSAWTSFGLPSVLALLLVAVPAVGQEIFRLGIVEPLNDLHPLRDTHAGLACKESGPFVAVWESESASGDFEVVARLFEGDGTPTAAEIPVNLATAGYQYFARVVRSDAGNFIVVWSDLSVDGPNDAGVRVRLFNAAGVGGPEFAANSHTTGNQAYPDVACDALGNFVVVWDGAGPGGLFGTWYRRFDSAGTPLGPEAILESGTDSKHPYFPVVAMNRSLGTFVAAWETWNGADFDVRARRFTAAGAPVGAIFDVNSSTAGTQAKAHVAMAPDGSFVVLFTGEGQGDSNGVLGQLFSGAGAPVGSEFWVNATTSGDQWGPVAAFDASGGFIVGWNHTFPDTRRRAYAARYSDVGVRTSFGDFPVTATLDPANTQTLSAICRDGGASFRTAFYEKALAGTDDQIFSQRLALGLFSDGFESAGTGAWSSALP